MRGGSVLGPEDRTGAWRESQKSSQRQDPGIHPCMRIRSHRTPRIPKIIPALGSGNSSRSRDPKPPHHQDPEIPPLPGSGKTVPGIIPRLCRSIPKSSWSRRTSQNLRGPSEHSRRPAEHPGNSSPTETAPGIPSRAGSRRDRAGAGVSRTFPGDSREFSHPAALLGCSGAFPSSSSSSAERSQNSASSGKIPAEPGLPRAPALR